MVDRSNLPTHIVVDPVSEREIYVYKDDFEESGSDIDKYFRRYDDPECLTFIRERASVDEVLQFANDIRAAGQGEIINELMLSEPQNSEGCLIANALNFSSMVNDDYGVWAMQPEDPDLISTICSELGLNTVLGYADYEEEKPEVGVELPQDIAYVAQAFDTYRDVELEKYDSLRQDNVNNPLV